MPPINPMRPRSVRHAAALPADIFVLRSGIPLFLPGRCINLSATGAGVAIAGEVRVGEAVGIKLRLPASNSPLQAKAVVRHRTFLACGLEFVGLSPEQITAIECCTSSVSGSAPPVRLENVARSEQKPSPPTVPHGSQASHGFGRPLLWATFAVALAGGTLGWWHWNRAWKQLESPQVPATRR